MKGFKLIVSLNLGFSICIFIGFLILIKKKFNMLKCATKISETRFERNRAIFKLRLSKLLTKSEIELKRMQSYMSSTDDDDCDSVILDRESSC